MLFLEKSKLIIIAIPVPVHRNAFLWSQLRYFYSNHQLKRNPLLILSLSSSSSCPIGLAPVGANHLRDQTLPYLSVLCKVEQFLSTALTPLCYVIQPLSTRTPSSRFAVHFGKYRVFDQPVVVHPADVTE